MFIHQSKLVDFAQNFNKNAFVLHYHGNVYDRGLKSFDELYNSQICMHARYLLTAHQAACTAFRVDQEIEIARTLNGVL